MKLEVKRTGIHHDNTDSNAMEFRKSILLTRDIKRIQKYLFVIERFGCPEYPGLEIPRMECTIDQPTLRPTAILSVGYAGSEGG